ncbi:MAG: sulfotransferase [Acidimicrobiales bacterium]|nr:sulfotransferase [Acidimicrobiales bacterium]
MSKPPPPPVHLDDLADPRFPPEIAELITLAAPLGADIRFEPDALLAGAVADTGLDDFGDDAFREPLGVLCRALEAEASLSDFGRLTTWTQLSQLARNRLLVQDRLRRHPEIRDIEIERPIVICGLPRTGTTHLHNLLAVDPALRSLPYWESLEPVPAPGEEGIEPDPRLERAEAGVVFLDQALPYFRRMHEMTTWHVHEEIQLLAIDFSTMLFDTIAPMPSWRAWYRAHDQTPHYEYLRTVLQVLQHLRGGRRWVLKSPQHLEQFAALRRVFPDATYVVTHRDPASVAVSMMTMVAYSSRLALDPVDPARIGGYWLELLGDLLGACAADRDLLPANQSVDVHFGAFMADEVGTVTRIHDLAGQPLTDETRGAMTAYLARSPRGRHGRVEYDLADLGLEEEAVRRAFAGYATRFGVEPERLDA